MAAKPGYPTLMPHSHVAARAARSWCDHCLLRTSLAARHSTIALSESRLGMAGSASITSLSRCQHQLSFSASHPGPGQRTVCRQVKFGGVPAEFYANGQSRDTFSSKYKSRLNRKRCVLCRVPVFVLLALIFSISGTVSITVKTVRPAASHRLYSD